MGGGFGFPPAASSLTRRPNLSNLLSLVSVCGGLRAYMRHMTGRFVVSCVRILRYGAPHGWRRVVDEDTVGNDDTIGEVFLSLSSLMEVESPSNNQGLPPPGPSRRPSKWHDVRVLADPSPSEKERDLETSCWAHAIPGAHSRKYFKIKKQVLDKMRTHSQMRTSLVERPRGRPNIMNIFKAAVDKVKPEGPTDGEVAAKLGAEDGRAFEPAGRVRACSQTDT